MAEILYKPILYQVSAFDASEEFTFFFSYIGSSLSKNTIVIRDNETNEEVYENTFVTMQLKNTVPANTLNNGKVYNVSIQVFDNDGNSSPFSDAIVVFCYTSPEFKITNISENQIISSSYYQVELSYEQIEGEKLNQYSLILYNANKIEIYNTGNIFNTSNLSLLISDLINGEFYYIRATGITIHGMIVDTGYTAFSVRYIKPPVYSLLGLENKPNVGAISITPNILTIEGTVNPDPPKFIDNKEIDLTEDDSYVKFDEAFNIENDFVIQLIGRSFKKFSEIIILENEKYKIEIKYMYGKFEGQEKEKYYFQLRAYNEATNYFLTSNYIDVLNNEEKIFLWIKKKNNIYELICEVLNQEVGE